MNPEAEDSPEPDEEGGPLSSLDSFMAWRKAHPEKAAGPGYRVYFARRGKMLIILLAGGDKSTQKADIRVAQRLAQNVQE